PPEIKTPGDGWSEISVQSVDMNIETGHGQAVYSAPSVAQLPKLLLSFRHASEARQEESAVKPHAHFECSLRKTGLAPHPKHVGTKHVGTLEMGMWLNSRFLLSR